MKYYRFISKDELEHLYKYGRVESKNTRPLFVLEENPKTKILTSEHNYNLTMNQFLHQMPCLIQISQKKNS